MATRKGTQWTFDNAADRLTVDPVGTGVTVGDIGYQIDTNQFFEWNGVLWEPTPFAGQPGLIYEGMAAYLDATNRSSYIGTGTKVHDLQGNLADGNINAATVYQNGHFHNPGFGTGNILFEKGPGMDNIFDGGGTILCWAEAEPDPVTHGTFWSTDNGAFGTPATAGYSLTLRQSQAFGYGLEFMHTYTPVGLDATRIWELNNLHQSIPYQLWNLITITFDSSLDPSVAGNAPVVTVNGVSQTMTLKSGVGILPAATDVNEDFMWGNRVAGGESLKGELDTLWAYNRILADNEIDQIYFVTKSRYLNTGMILLDHVVLSADARDMTLNGLDSERDGTYFVTGRIVMPNRAVTAGYEVRPEPIGPPGPPPLTRIQSTSVLSTNLNAQTAFQNATGWGIMPAKNHVFPGALYFQGWIFPAGARAGATGSAENARIWQCENSVYLRGGGNDINQNVKSFGSWVDTTPTSPFESIKFFSTTNVSDFMKGSEVSIYRMETPGLAI